MNVKGWARQTVAYVVARARAIEAREHRAALLASLGAVGTDCHIHGTGRLVGPERVTFGDRVVCGSLLRLTVFGGDGSGFDGHVSIGSDSLLMDDIALDSTHGIAIGDGVTIASRVTVIDHDHGTADPRRSVMDQVSVGAPIRVGDYSWIGEGAVILKGVELGASCIVGANAVVTSSFPPGSIVGGVPARLIGMRPGFDLPPPSYTCDA